MSDPQLKITPKSEHVEDVSATEFGNANLAILHDEALMVAEGEEKMTGELPPLDDRCRPTDVRRDLLSLAFTYLLACAAGLSGLLFGCKSLSCHVQGFALTSKPCRRYRSHFR